LKTFRGRAPDEAEGAGPALVTLLRTLPSSESLPTVGRFDEVTDVSELRRGLVVLEAVTEDAGEGRADGFRRIDLRFIVGESGWCCCCCCC